MDTATDLAGDVINKARGRKDSEGQEAVIKEKPLKDAVAELMVLNEKADAAKDKFNDAVKAVAEKAGMLAKVVRKAVKAKANDNIQEAEREAEQLSIAYEVVKKA